MKIAGVMVKMGVPILKYIKPDLLRRIKIMNHYNIDLLFDIGANTGQYGELMRTLNYKGDFVSFEPLNDAYAKLEKASKKDNKWLIKNYALGTENSKSIINIAGNSVSSSILDMEDSHINSAPDSKYIGQQEIEIKVLNEVFLSYYKQGNKVMLKIDTQGYEKQVLEGSLDILDKVTLIQMEMSLVTLYENEMLYLDMIHYLDNKGFRLIAFENGFSNPETGELLQVDGIFINKNLN